nr:unnamed protein product [Callosobruchus analis]
MEKEDIFDLKAHTNDTTLNWDRDENNEKIIITNIKVLEANYEIPNKIHFKYSYNEQFRTVDLLTRDYSSYYVELSPCKENQHNHNEPFDEDPELPVRIAQKHCVKVGCDDACGQTC